MCLDCRDFDLKNCSLLNGLVDSLMDLLCGNPHQQISDQPEYHLENSFGSVDLELQCEYKMRPILTFFVLMFLQFLLYLGPFIHPLHLLCRRLSLVADDVSIGC